jgi:hypothetical protein
MRAEDQRREALRKANAVRGANAQTKREMKTMARTEGLLYAADLIEANEWPAASMRIGALLRACPGVGLGTMTRFLRHAQIVTADKSVCELTSRQRQALIKSLRNIQEVVPYSRLEIPTVVVELPPVREWWCGGCDEWTSLFETGKCRWCDGPLSETQEKAA